MDHRVAGETVEDLMAEAAALAECTAMVHSIKQRVRAQPHGNLCICCCFAARFFSDERDAGTRPGSERACHGRER